MSWYDIEYSCGHSGRQQIYGKTSQRQRTADWIGENHVCPECYAAKKQADREAAIEDSKKAGAAAVEATADLQLPTLTGSEKQVAWAEQIRAKHLISDNAWAIKIQMDRNPDLAKSAKWWIDTRNRSAEDWNRFALSKDWDYKIGTPEMRAAIGVMRRVLTNVHGTDQIKKMSEMAAEIIGDKPRVANDPDGVDRWLIANWARTGLIEELQNRIAEANAKSAPAIDAAKESLNLAKAKSDKEEAQKIQKEADDLAHTAFDKQALASHLNDQADAAVRDASLRLGAVALIDNKEWKCRELMDDGNRVNCSTKNGAEWITFSAADFIAGVQAAEMAKQYGGAR
jgi:hypothetical protein